MKLSKLFRGRFECKLDSKGRFILPAAYRGNVPKKSSIEFVVTNSLSSGKRCLDIYEISQWEKLEKKISKMPLLKKEVQAYQRFYMSGGQEVASDSQHRLSIPQSLRQFASVEDEIVLVGMGNKIELWKKLVWEEMQDEMAHNFDDILAEVSQLEQVVAL